MQEALRARLAADAAVKALVAGRISWGRRRQGEALPAIVLTVVSGRREHQMTAPAGLNAARVQVDCWAEDYASCRATARAVIASLGGAIFAGVQGCFLDTERDGVDTDSGQRTVHRTSLDFRVWAEE